MSEIDLTLLPPAIEPYLPLGRSGLLPALHAAQDLYGYLPEAVAAQVARALGVPLADVYDKVEWPEEAPDKMSLRRVKEPEADYLLRCKAVP